MAMFLATTASAGGILGEYGLASMAPNPIVVAEDDGMVTFEVDLQFLGPNPCIGNWGNSNWGASVAFTGSASMADVGMLTPAGFVFSSTSGTWMITLMITDDTEVETTETLEVVLNLAAGGGTFINCDNPTGQYDAAALEYRFDIEIQDDDVLPMPEFSVQDLQVTETDAGSPAALIQVDMANGPAAQTISIDWQAVEGTATEDVDFSMAGGTVFILGGQSSTQINVPIIGDTLVEPDETFTVEISNPSEGVIVDGTGVVTILDNDVPPVPELSVQDISVLEGDSGNQTVSVQVTASPAPDQAEVVFEWITEDGTATGDDNDYLNNSGMATIQVGQTSTTIDLQVVGDLKEEGNEFFDLKIFNPIAATLGDDIGQITILGDDPSVLQVSVSDAQVIEGDSGFTTMEFKVEGVNVPQGAKGMLGVDYRTVSGTAVGGEDFVATEGTLDFFKDTSHVITVNVRGDTLDEPVETFKVELFNPQGVVIGDGEAEGRILNDDSGGGEISISDAEVEEGDEGTRELVFEVMLSPAQNSAVQVRYSTADDSAEEGSDYQGLAGILAFGPGETRKNITVLVNGDTDVEDDESFFVRLTNPINATIVDDQAEGVIVSDDGMTLPRLSIGDGAQLEGDSGISNGRLVVTLSQAVTFVVNVDYDTEDGTATAGSDYSRATGTLTFEPGETRQDIIVPVLGDRDPEEDETVRVLLSRAIAAEIADEEGELLIRDDDRAQATRINVNDVTLREGNAGTSVATFVVALTAPSEGRVMVDFTTEDGTALASDNDYRPVSGRLELSEGQQTATVEVQVVGDQRAEDDEFFLLRLSNPDGADLGRAEGRATVLNDDQGGPGNSGGTVRLLPVEPVMEGAGPAVIRVERVAGNLGIASVAVTTVAGTATAGQDFQPTTVRVQWGNGQSGPRSVEIPIVNDNVREPGEAFGVRLQAATGASIGAPAQTAVTITDDDTPMRLEVVGDAERTAKVRSELDLQVRVVTEDGSPVAGAPVQWAAEGQARVPGEGRVSSGSDGLVSQQILLAARPGPATIVARLLATDLSATFNIRVEGDLGDNVGGGDNGSGNDGDRGVAQTLDESCAEPGNSARLNELCEFLFDLGNTDDQREVVDQLTPRASLAQARTALRTPTQQVRNVTARLGAVRSGARGVAVGQLAFAVQGDGVNLGTLQQAVADYQQEDELFRRALSRSLARSAAKATPWNWQTNDEDDEEADRDPLTGLDAYDSTESPWGFFVNGRASFGDAPTRGSELGYDFATQGLTTGIDYRLSDQWILGASLGYARSDNDVVGSRGRDAGSVDSEAYSLSLFSSWYRDAFYVDSVVTFGRTRYDIERVVLLPARLGGRDRFVAAADPDGDQLSLHIGAGYDFRVGEAWTLSGFVASNFVRVEVDPFTERGAEFFNLTFDGQELESLLGETGLEVSYPVSVSWGVLQPNLRVAYLREFEDDVQIVRARFAEDPNNRIFRVASERPERSYFNVALGVTATLQKGWAGYLQYDTDLARDELDIYTLAGGFRFQF